MDNRKHDEHGNRCSCRLLAEAVGCNPKTIRFAYCQAVLWKHWVVECNHGGHDAPAKLDSRGKWHDIEPTIRAILIKNK